MRFGGGVWKQHEQQRARLEANVRALESKLATQRQELELAREAQSRLSSALEASEQHTDEVSRLLTLRSHEAAASAAALAAEHKRRDLREKRVQALEYDVAELIVKNASEERRRVEETARADRVQLAVESGKEEETRLCDLLYAAQEESEARGAELDSLRRQVHVLTHAKLSAARKNVGLEREKLALAQELAKVRGVNPKVSGSGAATAPPRTALTSHTAGHLSPMIRVSIGADKGTTNRQCLKKADTRNDTSQRPPSALEPPLPSGCSCGGAGFLWRELQLAGAKLRRAQGETAQLRERVEALEASERALIVRFRGGASARKRAEQRRPPSSRAA
ncbi:hypothetical protein PybrP1_007996 [[Pythium] brassicae (nom. inval.)]|nr:hypothetical protein PybrP1_007996 [[Pythium] brassicae (nom. inval.)]